MEGRALHEGQGAGPARGSLLANRFTRPDVRAGVLFRELAERERPSHPPTELARHGLELESKSLRSPGLEGVLGEPAIGILPLELGAHDVGRHEAGD